MSGAKQANRVRQVIGCLPTCDVSVSFHRTVDGGHFGGPLCSGETLVVQHNGDVATFPCPILPDDIQRLHAALQDHWRNAHREMALQSEWPVF